MTTLEIILSIFFLLVSLISCVLNFLQGTLIRGYKELIQKTDKQNEEVLKYCLVHIMNNAAEAEDFEVAERCRLLLEQLETKQ